MGLARALLLVGLAVVPLWAEDAPPENSYIGHQLCQACHPQIWQGFNRNPHFKSIALENRAPEKTGCEGCHGPGDLHVRGLGDTSKIVRYPLLEPDEVVTRCLECHAKDFGKMAIRRSAHTTAEVSCISCHSIHESHGVKSLLADQQRAVCYDCHLDIQARFNLPYRHRVNEGAMECTDCHNPHGSPVATWSRAQSPRMVKHAFGSDIACVKCHTDKRGPFVHEHPPVRVEGCTFCHNPHGSTNARLLTRPTMFTMCLECHNNVMGFGQRDNIPRPNPNRHNLADPSFQNCTACHSRIHGSNTDFLFRR